MTVPTAVTMPILARPVPQRPSRTRVLLVHVSCGLLVRWFAALDFAGPVQRGLFAACIHAEFCAYFELLDSWTAVGSSPLHQFTLR